MTSNWAREPVTEPKVLSAIQSGSNIVSLQSGAFVSAAGRSRQSKFVGKSGDGGGGMLEARVEHLESDMKEVKADLKLLRSDVAEIKGKVSMLPGYPGIAMVVGVIVAATTLASKYLPGIPTP